MYSVSRILTGCSAPVSESGCWTLQEDSTQSEWRDKCMCAGQRVATCYWKNMFKYQDRKICQVVVCFQ